MRLIEIRGPKELELALDILKGGGVIVFPTDTLYGLMAHVENDEAVERVFSIKGRDVSKPSPLLVGSLDTAQRYGVLEEKALRLWERFMPGALTLVVRAKEGLRIPGITSPEGKVGLRMPNHPHLLQLLRGLDSGVTGTSANPSGMPPARVVDEIHHEIASRVDAVFYQRSSLMGMPSTVVDVTDGVRVLREGAITVQEIEDALRG